MLRQVASKDRRHIFLDVFIFCGYNYFCLNNDLLLFKAHVSSQITLSVGSLRCPLCRAPTITRTASGNILLAIVFCQLSVWLWELFFTQSFQNIVSSYWKYQCITYQFTFLEGVDVMIYNYVVKTYSNLIHKQSTKPIDQEKSEPFRRRKPLFSGGIMHTWSKNSPGGAFHSCSVKTIKWFASSLVRQ